MLNRRPPRFLTDLAIAAAAAGAMTLLAILTKSFWGDDMWSIAHVDITQLPSWLSFGPKTATLAGDVHPPLYYWLLRVWTLGFGFGETGLRVFQGLIGFGVFLSALALFRLWFPERLYHPFWFLFLLAGEIWLCVPMLRYYSLALLLVLLATVFFLRWLRRPDRWLLLELVAAYSLLFYTDYPAFGAIMAGHFLFLLLRHRHRWPGFLGVAGIVLAVMLPWTIGFVKNFRVMIHLAPTVADFSHHPAAFILKAGFGLYGYIFGETILPNEPVVFLTVAALAAIYFFGTDKRLSGPPGPGGLLPALILGIGLVFYSGLTAWLYNQASFVYIPSHNLYLLPFVYVLLAVWHGRIRRPAVRMALIGIFVVINTWSIANWVMNRHFINPIFASPWKQICADLRGGQGMVMADSSPCLEYYEGQNPGTYPVLISATDFSRLLKNRTTLREPVFLLLHEHEASPCAIPDELLGWIQSHGRQVYQKEYLGYSPEYRQLKSRVLHRPAWTSKFKLVKYVFPG